LCAVKSQLPYIPDSTNPNGISLTIVPYLNFWPTAPAGSPFSANGDTQTFTTNGVVNLKENYATVRVDHQFSSSDTRVTKELAAINGAIVQVLEPIVFTQLSETLN
jgi:hypothetical protein